MLIQSVSLRLLESIGSSAWWMITVPHGTERAVAEAIQADIIMQGGSARLWPDQEPGPEGVTLCILSSDAPQEMPIDFGDFDARRSKMATWGVVALVIGSSNARGFLNRAPHVASFLGGRVLETSIEDDDAPPEYVARRLASLREAYGMTDDQAREAFQSGRFADDIHFLEWMVLLGDFPKESNG